MKKDEWYVVLFFLAISGIVLMFAHIFYTLFKSLI